jgi:hypothetical protein
VLARGDGPMSPRQWGTPSAEPGPFPKTGRADSYDRGRDGKVVKVGAHVHHEE